MRPGPARVREPRGNMSDNYELVLEPPDVDSYLRLRRRAGLSPRSRRAAELGLAGTWFGVHLTFRGCVVAMGRVVGDGGCAFQVVDVAVAPQHQGRGLGQKIVSTITDHLRARAPKSAQISLLADGTAHRLYGRFGFRRTAPASWGMLLRLSEL